MPKPSTNLSLIESVVSLAFAPKIRNFIKNVDGFSVALQDVLLKSRRAFDLWSVVPNLSSNSFYNSSLVSAEQVSYQSASSLARVMLNIAIFSSLSL